MTQVSYVTYDRFVSVKHMIYKKSVKENVSLTLFEIASYYLSNEWRSQKLEECRSLEKKYNTAPFSSNFK